MIMESFIKVNDPRICRTNTTGTVHVNKLSFLTFTYVIKMNTKTVHSVQSVLLALLVQAITLLQNERVIARWKNLVSDFNVAHLLLSELLT